MIDTHQHLIYPDRWSYPWLADVPALRDTFDLPRHQAEAEGLALAGSVFVEVDVAEAEQGAEAAFFCQLASDPTSGILGVIASCRPERDGFADYLGRIEHPRLVGLRRVLHVVPDQTSQTELFVENLQWLGEKGLSFDLCVLARQLPLALDLVRKCPQTQFVLDHCGNPPIGSGNLDAWREGLKGLADAPNVCCKISGLANHCPEGQVTAKAIRPVFDQVIRLFGWDRVLFGGDWPVCLLAETSLARWVGIVGELVAEATKLQRQQLFTDNARRVYGLGVS